MARLQRKDCKTGLALCGSCLSPRVYTPLKVPGSWVQWQCAYGITPLVAVVRAGTGDASGFMLTLHQQFVKFSFFLRLVHLLLENHSFELDSKTWLYEFFKLQMYALFTNMATYVCYEEECC